MTWSVVLPGPQGLGGMLLQCPCLYSFSNQLVMCSFSVYVMHHTVHTHTHTHSALCLQGPHLCVQPWFLQVQGRAGLCPGGVPGLCVGQSPRQGPQEAARPFLARWHSGDVPALGGSQSFPAFTPDPRVPLPRSLPVLELEAEPRSLRVSRRGSKTWGRGRRELGVGGGLRD